MSRTVYTKVQNTACHKEMGKDFKIDKYYEEKLLKENSFIKTKETKYATEYRNAGITLYVANNENNMNLVIDPDDLDDRLKKFEYKIYHSTALTNFPKRMNNGKTPIHYGYKFDFDDKLSINNFIKVLISK